MTLPCPKDRCTCPRSRETRWWPSSRPARMARPERARRRGVVARDPLILYEGGGLIRKVIRWRFRAARRVGIARERGNARSDKEW